MKDWNQERDRIVDWLRERVQKAKAKGVVLGLSGGIDSSVAGALAKIAFPENTLGLMLPCHSLPLDQQDAELIAGKFAISYQIFSLDFIYDSYLALLGESYSKLLLRGVQPIFGWTTWQSLLPTPSFRLCHNYSVNYFHPLMLIFYSNIGNK
jgi:NAD+ synthase